MDCGWGTQTHAQVQQFQSKALHFNACIIFVYIYLCICICMCICICICKHSPILRHYPSVAQVEDYDAEDDAEGDGRAVFLREAPNRFQTKNSKKCDIVPFGQTPSPNG